MPAGAAPNDPDGYASLWGPHNPVVCINGTNAHKKINCIFSIRYDFRSEKNRVIPTSGYRLLENILLFKNSARTGFIACGGTG
jgi:hypothetical protein